MSNISRYRHVQTAPLCLLLYAFAILFLVTGIFLKNEPPIPWLFPPIGLFMLVLAGSVHHLTVEDQTDHLLVSFGPLPLFRKSIRYDDITRAEVSRTTLLDGWGIHMSLRGGWVWNLWGRDCVLVQLRNSVIHVGTDDAEKLAEFLKSQIVKV